jgi:hypothetical protein
MWVFNEDGFFSTVVDRDDPTVLAVRSRDEMSIARFCRHVGIDPHVEAVFTPERDYQVRVRVPKAVWVGYMASKADGLDYVDYKSHMTERMHAGGFEFKQLKTLSAIWSIMVDHWEVRGQNDR